MGTANTANEICDFFVYSLKDADGRVVKVGQTKNASLRERQNKKRGYADCTFQILEVLPQSPRWFARSVEKTYQKMFSVLDSTDDRLVREKIAETVKNKWAEEKASGFDRFEALRNKLRDASFTQSHVTLNGLLNPRAKPANVYDCTTGDLIAEGVSLREWCRDNGYTQSKLSETATGKVKSHRGLRAEYINATQKGQING